MIRDAFRIYAEANSPNTVKTNTILLQDKFVLGNDQRQLISFSPIKSIILTDTNGNKNNFEVPSGALGYNKYLVTDDTGNLTWR